MRRIKDTKYLPLLFAVVFFTLGENALYSSSKNLKHKSTQDSIQVEERAAQFPNGNFMLWINSQTKYPVIAAENGIQGRVGVQFEVSAQGEVTDVKVRRSVDPSIDREAIRVIKTMPKWIPAIQNGHKVPCSFLVDISFNLVE